MLDSLVTNAEAMHYVKLNLVLDLFLGIIIAVALIRVFGIIIWDRTEPLREKLSKWCEKRRDRKYTMECIENLGKEKNILD